VAALEQDRPRSRGNSVDWLGPWNNFAAESKIRQLQNQNGPLEIFNHRKGWLAGELKPPE
jgi:hypothetical protein